MSSIFIKRVKSLSTVITQFDASSNTKKLDILAQLSKCVLPHSRLLIDYAELLLFMHAFPPDRKTLQAVEMEFARIARSLAIGGRSNTRLINSGLPYTAYSSKFSHELCNWLLEDGECWIGIDHFTDAEFDLSKVLAITLPSLERSETTTGAENLELLDALEIKPGHRVRFLVDELKKLNHLPRIKDHLFDGLGFYIRIIPRNKAFSRLYNRVPTPRPFFQDSILKVFDHTELLERPLGKADVLDDTSKKTIIRIVKRSMALTDRETDPTTYLDQSSLRYFELERGLSVAIHGMVAPRQLPLESYIGYTLFKNGSPVAYGGAWVFGHRADFGINIFEAYRGGESGYMLCQLLRVFRHVFRVSHFEIEPYQFGLDNPDGITTGAFWFYHRYGFRPVDPELLELSENEVKKRKTRKDHRTSVRVLKRFTQCNMALSLSKNHQPGVYDITDQVKRMIKTKYKGNRTLAEADCVGSFVKITGCGKVTDPDEGQVLKEVALWANATKQRDPMKLKSLAAMIHTKPIDPYRYQDLLLRYFEK